MKNEQIIEKVVETKKGNKLFRQAKAISKIVVDSGKEVLEITGTHKMAATSGLIAGLVKRDAKEGVKSALTMYAVSMVITTTVNIIDKREEIKNA